VCVCVREREREREERKSERVCESEKRERERERRTHRTPHSSRFAGDIRDPHGAASSLAEECFTSRLLCSNFACQQLIIRNEGVLKRGLS